MGLTITPKGIAFLCLLSVGGNVYAMYRTRKAQAAQAADAEKIVLRLDASARSTALALSAASNVAAVAAVAVSNAMRSAAGPAGSASAVTPPRYAVVSGYADTPGGAAVFLADGLQIRQGDYWPEQAGCFAGLAGSYAVIKDGGAVRMVSLLRRQEPGGSGRPETELEGVRKMVERGAENGQKMVKNIYP